MGNEQPSASIRFNALWQRAESQDSLLVAVVDEPYAEGSLRPERKSLGGVISGELVTVTNVDVAWRSKDETVLSSLAALEALK